MNKFENVDVLASCNRSCSRTQQPFQNDFDIDKKILTQAARNKNAEDKVYLWFSAPMERIVYRNRTCFCAERGSIIRSFLP